MLHAELCPVALPAHTALPLEVPLGPAMRHRLAEVGGTSTKCSAPLRPNGALAHAALRACILIFVAALALPACVSVNTHKSALAAAEGACKATTLQKSRDLGVAADRIRSLEAGLAKCKTDLSKQSGMAGALEHLRVREGLATAKVTQLEQALAKTRQTRAGYLESDCAVQSSTRDSSLKPFSSALQSQAVEAIFPHLKEGRFDDGRTTKQVAFDHLRLYRVRVGGRCLLLAAPMLIDVAEAVNGRLTDAPSMRQHFAIAPDPAKHWRAHGNWTQFLKDSDKWAEEIRDPGCTGCTPLSVGRIYLLEPGMDGPSVIASTAKPVVEAFSAHVGIDYFTNNAIANKAGSLDVVIVIIQIIFRGTIKEEHNMFAVEGQQLTPYLNLTTSYGEDPLDACEGTDVPSVEQQCEMAKYTYTTDILVDSTGFTTVNSKVDRQTSASTPDPSRPSERYEMQAGRLVLVGRPSTSAAPAIQPAPAATQVLP